MSEEEKKAIEWIKHMHDGLGKLPYECDMNKDIDNIHIVLKLIEKQQAKIKKKDKIIDLMAKKINEAFFESGDFEEWFENKICKVQRYEDYTYVEKEIKQYFEKKVEGE